MTATGYVGNASAAALATETAARIAADALLAPMTRTISTTSPLTGGGDLSANRTLAVTDASTSAKGVVQLGGVSGRVPPADYLPYDVRWSGVVGDGVTDDSAALAAAGTVCSGASKRVLYIAPELNVRLNSQVDLTRVRRIDCQGTITIGYTGGAGLIVGDTSTQRASLDYYFSKVAYAGVQTNVALRFVGMKNARATVQYCDYMQLYADSAVSTQTSIAYADFFIGRIPKLELFGEAGISWINENNFYGGSVDTLAVSGAYGHNNNHWHGTSMEGASSTLTIDATGASCNRFDLRGEAGPTVTFGTGTWANEVVLHFVSSPGVHAPAMTVTSDAGTENVFCSSLDTKMRLREIVKVDARSLGFNASSEISCPDASVPVPGFDRLALRTSFGVVLDTGIVPINLFLTLNSAANYGRNYGLTRLTFDSDVTLWRPIIYAFDSTGAAIDPTSTPWMLTTGGWVANAGGYYAFGSNVSYASMTITSTSVASIRITVAPSSTAGTAFRYVRLMGYVQTPQPDTAIEALRAKVRRPLYQVTTPTQGLARPGQAIGAAAGTFQCSTRVDTTLSVAAVSTDTTITVASATGISSGDVIGILLDSGLTHWTTVNGAPSGSVVTLTAAMPGAAAIGRSVGTNQWVSITAPTAVVPPLGVPTTYWAVPGNTYGTSAVLTNGQMMAIPYPVPRSGTATAIGFEFTVASAEATDPVVRLGLYADDGHGRPGALVVDGGTVSVASGTTPGQFSVSVNVAVTAGWYWLVGVVQGVSSAYPTLRVITAAPPISLSSMAVSTSTPKFCYYQNSVTGALPANYTSWTASSLVPKLMLQIT